MKHAYKLFTQTVLSPSVRKHYLTAGFALILSLCMGCISLNTVGNVGNFVLETVGDVNIFTDAEELQFGREYVTQHEKTVMFYTDSVVTNYINDLGQSLVRYSKRSNITYTFKVVRKKGINAYAVPGASFTSTLTSSGRRKTNQNSPRCLGTRLDILSDGIP